MGWHTPKDLRKQNPDLLVCTLGALFEETEEDYKVVSSWFRDRKLMGGMMSIPKGMLVARFKLKAGKDASRYLCPPSH